MLGWHIQVGLAEPQGLGEGDPHPVHPRGLGGDAPVTAKGGGGAVCPYVLDRCGGDSQRLSEAARFQLARPLSSIRNGGPRQDPGGSGRKDPRDVRYKRALALGVTVKRDLHRPIRGQEDPSGLVWSVHPHVHGRWLRRCCLENVHLQVGLRHGVEQVLLVRAIQAFPLVWVAEGADVLANEHAARIHGPEKPLNMPEAHPAVQVGEAEASAYDGHPQEGRGHLPRHPQRPGQDPVDCPLCGAKAHRARWHGLVDMVKS